MKKLTLESLEVTSFETGARDREERGTVFAHATNRNCTGIGCDTYICPTTPAMDCTYGCTRYNCVTNETNCIEM